MPFESEKQRRFMWANHPQIARRWAHEYGSKPKPHSKHKKEHPAVKGLKNAHKK